jgi:hypothetical protein
MIPHMSQRTSASRYLVALALGVLTVALFYLGIIVALGPPRSISPEEWPFLLFQILLAAAPFALLVRRGIRAWLPWIVGIALTLCFWAAFFASTLVAARDKTGANIGMGLIMFVSPFLIAGGALLAARLGRAHS